MSAMPRLMPYIAVLAMLFALMYAPLFHVHDDHDDHGSPHQMVHAHIVESTHAALEDHGDEIEAESAHHQARWVNLFTVTAPLAVHYIICDFTEPISPPMLAIGESAVLLEAPRAHSPPALGGTSPRPPPAL